jgi:hypothetical protein
MIIIMIELKFFYAILKVLKVVRVIVPNTSSFILTVGLYKKEDDHSNYGKIY